MKRYSRIEAIERAVVVLVLAIGVGMALLGTAAPLLFKSGAGAAYASQADSANG